jgi:hypothetical protein
MFFATFVSTVYLINRNKDNTEFCIMQIINTFLCKIFFMQEITDRFLKFCDYLISKNIIKNATDFAKEVGISNSMMTELAKGRSKVGTKAIHNSVLKYYLNTDWLYTGQGEMLKNTEKSDVKFYESGNIPSGRKLIPFYDIETEAGTIQVSNMEDGNEPAEYIDAGDWFLDAESAMRVHGDSMFPEYKSGSIIVMREVFDKRLIVYGEDYMIQTLEYRAIKRLYKGNNESCWIACSVNDEVWEKGPMAGRLIYEPFDIFLDDVIKVCRVLGCVKRNESSRIVYNRRKK